MSAAAAARRRGWGFTAPALIWTLVFFAVPFLAMAAMSLAALDGRELVRDLSLANCVEAAENAHPRRAVMVSLEITLTVTVVSVLPACPLA